MTFCSRPCSIKSLRILGSDRVTWRSSLHRITDGRDAKCRVPFPFVSKTPRNDLGYIPLTAIPGRKHSKSTTRWVTSKFMRFSFSDALVEECGGCMRVQVETERIETCQTTLDVLVTFCLVSLHHVLQICVPGTWRITRNVYGSLMLLWV